MNQKASEDFATLILICKDMCGFLSSKEKALLPASYTEAQEKERQAIKDIIEKKKNELSTVKQSLEQKAVETQQNIDGLEQNKVAQVNNIPLHLRAINQANINVFVAGEDEKIRKRKL